MGFSILNKLDTTKKRGTAYIIFIVTIGLLGITLYTIEHMGIIQIDCPIHTFTGFDCPACGSTRLVGSLLELDLYQAFRWNPLVFLSIPYYIYLVVQIGFDYTYRGVASDKVATTLTIYVVLFITFGILRNTQMFNILAPTSV